MPDSGPVNERTARPRSWESLLGSKDHAVLERFGAGRRIGFGATPAVVVIDAQNYMVGPPPGSEAAYPSACGAVAQAALRVLRDVLSEARRQRIPIFYTKYQVRRDGLDMGVYRLKRGLPDTEGWCLEESEGAEITAVVAPGPRDIVLIKNRPSAFWGTPLLGLLIARKVDTLIVAGGSTSNCVRATVVDAMSFGYRTTVIEDCVFDRFDLSHAVTLFDLERQYSDVLGSEAVLAYMRTVGKKAGERSPESGG